VAARSGFAENQPSGGPRSQVLRFCPQRHAVANAKSMTLAGVKQCGTERYRDLREQLLRQPQVVHFTTPFP